MTEKKENRREMVVQVSDSQAITLIGTPSKRIKDGQAAAKELMKVARPIDLGGKMYLRYEDWQTIGAFFGLMAGAEDAEPVTVGGVEGFKASAVVRKVSDGTVVSSATGYCLHEGNWLKREKFSLASMAQTRAAAKALRNALSWVAVLGGYEGTPVEEMPDKMEDGTPIETAPRPNSNGYACIKCGGAIYDNRINNADGYQLQVAKSGKNRPAFSCKNKECAWATWDIDAGVVFENAKPVELVAEEYYAEAVDVADAPPVPEVAPAPSTEDIPF